jgi:hypothetical protein
MFIIHDGTGFLVKPGMTTLNLFTCRSNIKDLGAAAEHGSREIERGLEM